MIVNQNASNDGYYKGNDCKKNNVIVMEIIEECI